MAGLGWHLRHPHNHAGRHARAHAGRRRGHTGLKFFPALRDRFASIDPRSLGLFRLFFGALLLWDLLRRIPVLVDFFTNEGVLPNHFALFRPMGRHAFSLFHACSTRGEAALLFAIGTLVYLCFLLGYKTRFAQIGSFVFVTSLHSRNILIEHGGDVVMNLLAAWTMFLPLGRRFSLDALLRSMRARKERHAGDLNERVAPPEKDLSPAISFAATALLLQFVAIYALNTLSKTGATWREGTAVYYLLHQERVVTPIGLFVRTHAPLALLKALSYGTLAIEGLAPLLFLASPFLRISRVLALVLLGVLHVMIALMTNIELFQLCMIAFTLTLLRRSDWEALGARHLRRRGRLTLIYDAGCGFCHACSRLLVRLDPLHQITFIGNDDLSQAPKGVTAELTQKTVVVVDPESGRLYQRTAAFAKILRVLPGFWPLGALLGLPGITTLADWLVYDRIAKNRHRLSAAMGLPACGIAPLARAPSSALSASSTAPAPGSRTLVVLREGAVLVLFLACLSQLLTENSGIARHVRIEQPAALRAIVEYPRLFQGWSMFAPDAPRDDEVLVIDGITDDGLPLDPLTFAPPRFEILPPRGEYPMQIDFCNYENRIRMDAFSAYRPTFQQYLLRRATKGGVRLRSFDAYWVMDETPPPGSPPSGAPRRQKLFSYP